MWNRCTERKYGFQSVVMGLFLSLLLHLMLVHVPEVRLSLGALFPTSQWLPRALQRSDHALPENAMESFAALKRWSQAPAAAGHAFSHHLESVQGRADSARRPAASLESDISQRGSRSSFSAVSGPSNSLLHILTTRFQQNQAHLLELGRARLLLFRTFCLPSILNQTILRGFREHPKFLWIIMIDPKLEPLLLQGLLQMVMPYEFIYLVATNYQGRLQWRSGEAGNEFFGSKIFSGNIAWLQHAHATRESRPLLQTGLDADDGLHFEFLETVQKEAMEQLNLPGNKSATRKKWKYWCVDQHVEWYPTPPNVSTSGREHGLFSVTRIPKYCVTPGLTLGMAARLKDSKVPKENHAHLFRRLEKNTIQCGKTPGGCVTLVALNSSQAVRARTTTSAGMKKIILDQDMFTQRSAEQQGAPADTNITSWIQQLGFGLRPTEVSAANRHMQANFAAIAEDNLKGQCTPGHSCKTKSRESLSRIIGKSLAEVEEEEDENDKRSQRSKRPGRTKKKRQEKKNRDHFRGDSD